MKTYFLTKPVKASLWLLLFLVVYLGMSIVSLSLVTTDSLFLVLALVSPLLVTALLLLTSCFLTIRLVLRHETPIYHIFVVISLFIMGSVVAFLSSFMILFSALGFS